MQCEIKTLEWSQYDKYQFARASGVGNVDYVMAHDNDKTVFYLRTWDGFRSREISEYKTLEQAEIAAQAHFEGEVMQYLNVQTGEDNER